MIPSLDQVPRCLRELRQWVAWRLAMRGDDAKATKLPVNPHTGELASTTDAASWSSIEEAVSRARMDDLAGIGFVFAPGGGIVGIDLDHCRDPASGEVELWALELIHEINSYTELSPSGTGYHILLRGELPPGGRRRGKVEMYDAGRYFTITGQVFVDPSTKLPLLRDLEPRQAELDHLHKRVFGDADGEQPPAPRAELSDEEVIGRARSGERSGRLWAGDTTGYPSPSEADLALCGALARLVGPDAARIDRLFRASGLMRPKWDELRGEQTYGAMTVQHCLKGANRQPSWRVPVVGGRPLQVTYRLGSGRSKPQVIVEFPEGPPFSDRVDVASAKARSKLLEAITVRQPGVDKKELSGTLDEIARDVATASPDARDARDASSGDPSESDLLISLAHQAEGVELFHKGSAHDCEPYAWIDREKRKDTLHILTSAFRWWLQGEYFRRYRRPPKAQSVTDAINSLAAIAIFEGEEREVAVRVAELDGEVWIDLGDKTGRAVRVRSNGWEVVQGPDVPVRFLRKRGMKALPVPVARVSVDELRTLLNVPDDGSWTLLVACLVGYLRPTGPYPILIVTGEQGSAKSMLCRILRAIIDPNLSTTRRLPRDDRDLMIAATNCWVLSYDNVSAIPIWLSDALCTVSTGGGYATRQLWTDEDEKIFEVTRPIVLNGIGEFATRPDILERAIILSLPIISEESRRSEQEIWQTFNMIGGGVFGALLDGVASALLRLPNTVLESKPRMADFALWVSAAEQGLGWEEGRFMAAYGSNRQDANTVALEAYPVIATLLDLLEAEESWEGTAQQLLKALQERAGINAERPPVDWPKTPKLLSADLRRVAPNLRQQGIDVAFHKGVGTRRQRVIRIERVCNPASPASPASGTPPDGAVEGDSSRRRGDAEGPGDETLRLEQSPPGGLQKGFCDAPDAGDAGDANLQAGDSACGADPKRPWGEEDDGGREAAAWEDL